MPFGSRVPIPITRIRKNMNDSTEKRYLMKKEEAVPKVRSEFLISHPTPKCDCLYELLSHLTLRNE
jgi:hypothetical protein